MAQNEKLHHARSLKDDEFYTQYEDIEDEMQHYKPHFNNKTIYCNCDHPDKSNFVKYFINNFSQLNLKKLIATWHNPQGKGLLLIYDGTNKQTTQLQGNGDFRNEESLNLLKQADIVVTNPPFSLFRQYVNQLNQFNKKYIIIGNKNAISYKEIFPYIKNNQMWIGHRPFTGGMWFETDPDTQCKTTKTTNDGRFLGNVASCWFTNLDHEGRHTPINLTKNYTPEEYPKYDNYDAIEVTKTKNIPSDYDGIMGVPITFLDKYDPDQFEIVDINPHFFSTVEQGLPKPKQLSLKNHGMKDPYARVLIRRKPQNQSINDTLKEFIEKSVYDYLFN